MYCIPLAWLVLLVCNNVCGRRRRKLTSYQYIPNEPANPNVYPYVVKLFIRYPDRENLEVCTGALITRSVVLTAGHCLATEFDEGHVERVELPPGIYSHSVECKSVHAIHRIYPPENDFTAGDLQDFGIVVLKESIPICSNKTIVPIPVLKLPVKNIHSRKWEPSDLGPQEFNNCTLIGYGKTIEDGQHNLRRITQMGLWHRNDRFLVPLLKLDYQGRTCYGDSGGPTICDDSDGVPRIYGITSFAAGQLEAAKKRCYGEDSTYLVDVLTDVQYILPKLKDVLQHCNKLQELVDDYKKCSHFQ